MIKLAMKNALLDNPLIGLKVYREMSKWGYQLWTNFINGSYGEGDFDDVIEMKDAPEEERRKFVIRRYTGLLAIEFNCSYGYAQKVIVGFFTKKKLASITDEFIDEMARFTITQCNNEINDDEINADDILDFLFNRKKGV
jgi:hypothetical protein